MVNLNTDSEQYSFKDFSALKIVAPVVHTSSINIIFRPQIFSGEFTRKLL
jgi:hypothetical protein